MTLGDLIVRNARLYPHKTALTFEGKRWSFREFAVRAHRLNLALRDMRICRGTRIAVLAQNCPQYLELFGAAELGGFTLVTLNWRLSEEELGIILDDCRPDVLFFQDQFRDAAETLKRRSRVKSVIAIDGTDCADRGYESLIAQRHENEIRSDADPEDIAYIIYTSGTTGKPKGVMLSQKALLESAKAIALDGGARPTDTMLIVMPFFHIGARIEALAFFLVGAKIYLQNGFQSQNVLRAFSEDRVTVAHFAPVMVHMLLDEIDASDVDMSSLRLIQYASAAMNVSLLRRAISRFGCIFMQIYGMTECIVGTILHPQQHILEGSEAVVRRLASAGQPFIGVDIQIVGLDGRLCAINETGEIFVRSPGLMSGYWNGEEHFHEVVRDGWIATGDMGCLDDEGYLFISDRKKDMIISGGENIYSREVEEALQSHPAVKIAGVIGVPDEKWGESVRACVVLKEGLEATPEELVDHVRGTIASYKKPRSIVFLSELPLMFNGKIDKKALRAGHSN